LCETWHKNTVEKQNCFQLEFLNMMEFLKKNRTQMLTIRSRGSRYTNFLACKTSYEHRKPNCNNQIL